jgi:membrane associated rhomboid family serine protease
MFAIPPLTRALIIANVVVYFAETVAEEALIGLFALWPIGPGFAPWQLVTYSFLHGSVLHLFFNMLALYMFGSDIERIFGRRRYFAYYFTCVLGAALMQLLVSALSAGPPYPTLGASGGVFGILLAFALYFPHRIIMLIFPPIPMPAWLFVVVYGLIELYLGVTGTQAGVAHFAHLGGMLGGFMTIQYWRGRWPFAKPRW